MYAFFVLKIRFSINHKTIYEIPSKLILIYRRRAAIVEINIDENRDLATQYMVQSIPTLILFKNGGEIKRFVGLQDQATLEKNLDQVL